MMPLETQKNDEYIWKVKVYMTKELWLQLHALEIKDNH